jgi:hypothetical protein
MPILVDLGRSHCATRCDAGTTVIVIPVWGATTRFGQLCACNSQRKGREGVFVVFTHIGSTICIELRTLWRTLIRRPAIG